MAFKDLLRKLEEKSGMKVQIQTENKKVSSDSHISSIAKNIVDRLYSHVVKSVNSDRSSVKLNMFERAAISSGLNRMAPGTKEYIDGMRSDDVKLLLDDILGCYTTGMLQEELDKRRKS